MQRQGIGFGQAERIRDQQPRRRLIVLEGEHPVGLVTNEARGNSAGGLPFDLFERYQQVAGDALRRRFASHQPERTCPSCNQPFIFYALQPEHNAYACPHCHTILDEG